MEYSNSTETPDFMWEPNDTDDVSPWCENNFSIPSNIHPCAGRIFCLPSFEVPFENTCDATSQSFTRAIGFVNLSIISLNIVSLIVFNRMKMIPECLFLLKCLAVFDSLPLLGAFLTFAVEYYKWAFGYGYNRLSAYIYVERISYYLLYRLCGALSYWLIPFLTIQRWIIWLVCTSSLFQWWFLLTQKILCILYCRYIGLTSMEKPSSARLRNVRIAVMVLIIFFVLVDIPFWMTYKVSTQLNKSVVKRYCCWQAEW